MMIENNAYYLEITAELLEGFRASYLHCEENSKNLKSFRQTPTANEQTRPTLYASKSTKPEQLERDKKAGGGGKTVLTGGRSRLYLCTFD